MNDTNLVCFDDSAAPLDIGERFSRREDGLEHKLLINFTMCLTTRSVGCTEYKPT